MTLREALLASNQPAAGPAFRLQLCCGFEPLHLVSFLRAHLMARLEATGNGERRPVEVGVGVYGDITGNLERALASPSHEPVVVVLEWADIDPRLGLRDSSSVHDEKDIDQVARVRLARIEAMLTGTESRRKVMALPSTPLPPWIFGLVGQVGAFELRLRALVAEFAARCATAGVRVTDAPAQPAYDLRGHLHAGYPYAHSHTDELAGALTALLLPAPPKKALVTDLDNTLWRGVVGDDGAANVHWSLDHQARVHGIYQQFLAELAVQGVLIGVASKNNPGPVREALARPDLLLPETVLFPVETNWGPKTESLRRIALAWNIGLDSIVFVDDDPLELAQVERNLSEVECHRFRADEPGSVLELIRTLRTRFARERVTEEDRLRAESLRSRARRAVTAEAQSSSDPEAVVADLTARIQYSLARKPFDERVFELLNKTNQFNLNGNRWEESSFRAFLDQENSLLFVVSYQDKFGALGKIAAGVGTRHGSELHLHSWVMSCRAFSRRIEYATLEALFRSTGVEEIVLEWRSTPRNSPTRDALAKFWAEIPESGQLRLSREGFAVGCPRLYAIAESAD